MKKVLFLLVFLAQGYFLSAQLYVEGTMLTTANTSAYLEATPLRRTDGTYHFQIDYGQKADREVKPGECLTDDKARRYEFRSAVDGLNFLYEHGWEVVVVYDVSDMRRYLLKKRG
ncbi:MAG: hypothetical protein EP344_00085 [Bacteroidetes bacterium]|nr:MAG: hypothetical protein EP344_00085 [Bacteroidota bacterium]